MTHASDVIRESDTCPTLQARMGTGGNQVPIVLSHPQGAAARAYTDGKTGTLTAAPSSEPVVLDVRNINRDRNSKGFSEPGAPCGTLTTGPVPAIAIQGNVIGRKPKNGGNGLGVCEGIAPTLTATDQHGVAQGLAVRRLTPVECERLMGMPDNWTRISWKGKPPEECPDAPRYKAIGNSRAVPVISWIGRRILEEMEKERS